MSKHLQSDQLGSIVARLNRRGEGRIPAMWELVVLDSLGRMARLKHEVELPDGRRPDFELIIENLDGSEFLLIGDITTISDAALIENNPEWALSLELSRLARKYGLNPNHFGYRLSSHLVRKRSKLFLPPRGKLLELLGKELPPWMRKLRHNLLQHDIFDYVGTTAKFSISYDVTQRYQSGSSSSYDTVTSPTKNTLSTSLKSKVAQLRSAPPEATRLIIVCDGSSSIFRNQTLRSMGTFNCTEIATDFLRQNSSIDAVILVTVDGERTIEFLGDISGFELRLSLVFAPPENRSARLSPHVLKNLEDVCEKLVTLMPTPVRSPRKAAHLAKNFDFGPDIIGALKMNNDRVAFSVRALQHLLAGQITVEEFNAAHGWDEKWNPFEYKLREGRMISKAEIVSGGDRDDDWIALDFGRPDPAVTQFNADAASKAKV
ncbi:MAG: hypothetical protein ABIT83_13215 [Massilia sp.]